MNRSDELMEVRNRNRDADPENSTSSVIDNIPIDDENEDTRFKKFKGRHIQMMALGDFQFLNTILNNSIGASIGTGVLYESGYLLSIGGPVTLLFAYLWTATILFAIMERLLFLLCTNRS
jgi:amino acid permease